MQALQQLGHDFVSAVSHDLRTPLAQIRLLGESLLLGSDSSPEERERWVRAIVREARVLDDRIANVLLFAHGDGLSSARERADLAVLLGELAELYAPVAEGRGMRLCLEPLAPLPLLADARALRQAIANLIDNALRFGPEGQAVTLAARLEGGRVSIRVSDQGPGVRDERLWLPFERRDVAPGSAGAGLGLAVVRRVAEHHGGYAYAEPCESGSSVTLSIPV